MAVKPKPIIIFIWPYQAKLNLAKTEFNSCFIIYLNAKKDIRTYGSIRRNNDQFFFTLQKIVPFFFHKYIKRFQNLSWLFSSKFLLYI